MAGHLSKRKKGGKVRWRARYPDPSYGGHKEVERVFGTRREAERWLNEQRVAVQRGIHIDPANSERIFKDVANAWRATWLELEPKTKAGYESINPCDAVRLPRRSAFGANGVARDMLFLSAAEVEAVAESINQRYRVLIYTARIAAFGPES